MCNSSNEGKDWTVKYLNRYLSNVPNPKFLDIGTGQGTYFRLLNSKYENAHWTGVEAYKPYIENYGLMEKYHTMHHADARELYGKHVDVSQLDYHTTFCGDVLEHMTKEQALALVEKLTLCSGIIVISIPIVKWPQHDHVNEFQNHVKDDWSHDEVMGTFPGIIDFYKGVSIGVYVIAGNRYTGDRHTGDHQH
jgi:2-polyprenyl-3-methyl-5-hydroxy-6-metoxy-1,4-benzoquinol methylase